MRLPSTYALDKESIKLNAYRLLCHFYANKEIARSVDPDNRDDPFAKLEDCYFHREMSKLLIDIAISLRILDDQMSKADEASDEVIAYNRRKTEVNRKYSCMMFDDMSLREVCNKIIHAEVVEPHFAESDDGTHKIDSFNWLYWSDSMEQSGDTDIPKPEPIKWKYLARRIRLGGRKGKQKWWFLLEVPTFVNAIIELLDE
ncbi:hypothetical protein HG263_12220 [Pseudoalteromonas sp. JBTF-M23]|uniref:Uncharacterized protein n=1 Tax=Pseudoalteromonas caenipelagi TaxID=2726988 RepID=A0A849VFK5_9GAMM|nr:hypothetical protein [Pseudoalteromonas caenipelagi]NOU51293.1 hypothetical protein [Pseudoalteromonas caenipelagi]